MDRIDDCLWLSLKYVEKEKYRKSPEPSMYAAMCFLKVADDPNRFEGDEYRKPLNQAYKYARKGIRKDKDGVLYSQNQPFFEDLQERLLTRASWELEEDEYRKASTWLKKAMYINEDDAYVKLALGLSQMCYRSKAQGKANMEEAATAMETTTAELTEQKEAILLDLFIVWSYYVEEDNTPTDALDALQMAREYLGNDQDIDQREQELREQIDQG